jgi:hypothetical protein
MFSKATCYDLGDKIKIKKNNSVRDNYIFNRVNYLILIRFISRINVILFHLVLRSINYAVNL